MSELAPNWHNSALNTDLYQLTMLEAYHASGMNDTAVFEFFARRLPPERGFLVAAGLEQALGYLESLHFTDAEIATLADTGLFDASFLETLAGLTFTGDVEAMPEGTLVFPDEPLLRVTAPLREAQLVESRLINLLHFSTLIASKAARCVVAGGGRQLVDFGMRRAHGAEAALLGARAAYVAGFDGSATMLARHAFGIPAVGTMAHSFIEAHESELEAFENFARCHRGAIVLLIDTYDTATGARRVAELADRLAEESIRIAAVRLDSGDLAALAREVRGILDAAGHEDIGIFASGGLDEHEIARLLGDGVPIDGFGIGTSLDVSQDVPAFDCAYKLQEYAGIGRRKKSAGKSTWPGAKQVFRHFDTDGRLDHDVLSLADDAQPGEPQLVPVMRGGRRLASPPTLDTVREHARAELDRLPRPLRSLTQPAAYRVEIAPALEAHAREVDRRLGL